MAAAGAWVDQLELTWRSIDELCSGLTEAEWKTATGCPGWTVQDNLSHLVDYEATALGRPRPDHQPSAASHTRNALGESNEVGVDARRDRAGARVLDEFREVVAERLSQLRALTAEQLAEEITTPAGPGTVADMLTLRVMDTWSHEQDIRRALGRPGHEDGPAAAAAVAYFAGLLPYVVGKRAGAPDGATVVVEIGDLDRRAVEVVDGRARPLDSPPDGPTTTVRMPVSTFAALVGGRTDAPDDVVVTGDDALGRAVVAALGVMP